MKTKLQEELAKRGITGYRLAQEFYSIPKGQTVNARSKAGSVARWISGNKPMSVDRLEKICEVVNRLSPEETPLTADDITYDAVRIKLT